MIELCYHVRRIAFWVAHYLLKYIYPQVRSEDLNARQSIQ